jgi:hypothetical protein
MRKWPAALEAAIRTDPEGNARRAINLANESQYGPKE